MSSPEGNEWDSYAGSWDDDEAVQAYADAAFATLLRLLDRCGISLDGARVIDFGCGTGQLTERLVAGGATVLAIDTSAAMLAVLEKKISESGWSGVTTSSALPPPGPAYDLVICSSVCAFVDDYPGTVRDLVSRVGSGGLFVQWDWERNDHEQDSFGLSRTEIGDALVNAGLAEISVETAFVVSVEGESMEPLMGSGRRV